MIRFSRLAVAAVLLLFCGLASAPAVAQSAKSFQVAAADDMPTASTRHKTAKKKPSKAKPAAKATSGKSKAAKAEKAKAEKKAARHGGKKKNEDSGDTGEARGKPTQVGSFGDWGAFVAASGDDKTCYVLAQPKSREPSKLKRDPAYVFISSRPGENIHNEVSITMGFPMKDGGDAQAEVGAGSFDLVSKGKNAWVKNPAEEGRFIAAMRHNAKLVIKAPSIKGNVTTDSYSLAGLRQALDRVQKECR